MLISYQMDWNDEDTIPPRSLLDLRDGDASVVGLQDVVFASVRTLRRVTDEVEQVLFVRGDRIRRQGRVFAVGRIGRSSFPAKSGRCRLRRSGAEGQGVFNLVRMKRHFDEERRVVFATFGVDAESIGPRKRRLMIGCRSRRRRRRRRRDRLPEVDDVHRQHDPVID